MASCGSRVRAPPALTLVLLLGLAVVLPSCHTASIDMRTFRCGASTYLSGDHGVTLDSARQSCLNANSTLLNHLFLATLSAEERGCVLNRANPIWNVDANDRQYAFDAALGVQDFTIPQNDEQVFGFVCLPTNYKSLMASSAPAVDTRSEVLRCRGLPEVYSCNDQVNIPDREPFNLCLPRCSNQAPFPPTHNFTAGEYRVTITELSVTSPVARSQCKLQGLKLMRYKDLPSLIGHPQFAVKLNFGGMSDIWMLNKGRKIAKYALRNPQLHLPVNVLRHSTVSASGFVCIKDISPDRCLGEQLCPENHKCVSTSKGYECRGINRCVAVEETCNFIYPVCVNSDIGFKCEREPAPAVVPGYHANFQFPLAAP
ncbi:uncharacterized protein LOC135812700 [Sycon ciliatum]|uniref:uncharacterized protein LOC135812700 n=1 Tax=Sycon ciliatum TaxID=27933 RepID=UPI0031F6B8D3